MNPILKAAIEYVDSGICVIPIRPRDKKPLIPWQEFQHRRPTEDELYGWYEFHPERNIGIVCGAVSGNLVVVDIDGENGSEWARNNIPTTSIYVKTPGNLHKYHAYYKVKNIASFKNLVKRIHPEIDIRCDGGYVVAPPSTHPNGGVYQLEMLDGAGGWDGLADLPPFSNLGGGLDLSGIKLAPTMEPKPEGSRNQSLAQLVGRWCSKGLDLAEVVALAEKWNLGNQPPLETKELFRTVSSIVNTHNRNHPATMIEVGQDELPEVDFDDPVENTIPRELLTPGGLLQEIMEYTDRSNVASVPVFALAGAIALIGAVCGQRIMTETRLRTNMYVVSLGYSGAGKNAACSAIPQILLRAARDVLGPTELASAQSVLKWLAYENRQVTLVCVDELGMLLKGLRYPESPKADMPRILTRLFSSTDKPDVKSFADMKLNFTIPYHCLSLYGASTPGEFWKGLNLDDGANGFLARLLIFDSRNGAPRPKRNIDASIPAEIIEKVSALWKIKPPIDPDRGNMANVPIPFIVKLSSEARWTWDPWADKYFDLQNKHIADPLKSSVYGRAAEHAGKLALIHAVSLQGAEIINGGEVGTDSVLWAIGLIEWLINGMISNATECISSNQWHDEQKKITKIIKQIATKDKPGATIREIKRLAYMPTRLFDDILNTLEHSGKIHRRSYKPERGPEGTIFCNSKAQK